MTVFGGFFLVGVVLTAAELLCRSWELLFPPAPFLRHGVEGVLTVFGPVLDTINLLLLRWLAFASWKVGPDFRKPCAELSE